MVRAAGRYRSRRGDDFDLARHIRTYATALGPPAAFLISQIIFVAAFLSLWVAIGGEWNSLFRALVILLWLMNTALAVGYCWKQINQDSVERYRRKYRILYLLIGLCLLLRVPLFQH